FGGEEERLALELADRLRVGLSLHAPRAQLVPPAPGRRLVAGHDAVDLERRLLGDVAIRDVRFDSGRIALPRIAVPARRGAEPRVDIRRALHEVLLAKLKWFFQA